VTSPATILTASPWTSAGFTVSVTNNTDVKFQFSNETTPPTNVFAYFYNANTDKYVLTTFGTGNLGYGISTVLGSTFASNQSINTFFTGFGSFQIQLDLTPTNLGGSRKTSPPTVNINCYVVFQF
jgi:hypothetical protein